MYRLALSVAAVAALAIPLSNANAQMTAKARTKDTAAAFTGHELAGQASVQLERARAIALKARPGVITDQELEKEAGGTGLRYSFDVRAHGRTYEIGVDARTAAVLENKTEGRSPD